MNYRDALNAAATQKYQHCEDAQTALKKLNKRYKNTKFGTKKLFLATLYDVQDGAPDERSLKRGLNAALSSLFDETFNIWLDVADGNVDEARTLHKTYKRLIDGKRDKLMTIQSAPTGFEFQDRIATQTKVLEAQVKTPPLPQDAVIDDWSLELAGVKGACDALAALNTQMADWIVKAEKEAREKAANRRGVLGMILGVVGGGGLFGIAEKWEDIVDFFRGFF